MWTLVLYWPIERISLWDFYSFRDRSTETVSSSLHLAMVVVDNSGWPVIDVVRADGVCCGKELHVSRTSNHWARNQVC